MTSFNLDNELHLCYVKASSFPEGIMDAFKRLEDAIGGKENRVFFGLSKPQHNGVIEYQAAVLESQLGEAARLGLETYTLPRGTYVTHVVPDFMNNVAAIGQTFQQLLDDPLLDPDAWCVEWYRGNDVMCMVKINK